MIQFDPTEYAHTQKQLIRSFLLERGWRRCGRTKKYEVYKKTVRAGGTKTQYRVKFDYSTATFGQFHPATEYNKSYWNTVDRVQYNRIEDISDLMFVRCESVPPREVRPMTEAEEDMELSNYFDRLGLAV